VRSPLTRASQLSLRLWLAVALSGLGFAGMWLTTAPPSWFFEPKAMWVASARPPSVAAASLSIGLGLLLASATIYLTRRWIAHTRFGSELSRQLMPQGTGWQVYFTSALLPALAEEIFFRGFLCTSTGIAFSSAAFGLMHRAAPGARWSWTLSAFCFGVGLALVYRASGSLAGAILAHAIVNALNLRYLASRRNTYAITPTGG
jgi:membrane protease YdiL (CAAX protease family)